MGTLTRHVLQSTRHQFVNLNMTYDVTGSGTGKARIMKEEGPEVQFAGSDSLLKESDYEAHPDLTLQMFPTMAG